MSKVSAIVPSYNHAAYLDQRIESILSQTYEDLDLYLLDDASPDGSAEILKRYADHPKVKAVICNSVNTGTPFKQWNKGVAASRSEYIWIAESDDYADIAMLEKLVSILDRHPNVGVAYCQSLAVDETGKRLYSLKGWTDDLDENHWASDYVGSGRDECRLYLATKCTIPNASAVLFRRSAYESVNGADEDFRLAGDWMLWVKLLLNSDVGFIAEPLNYFRVHGNTVRAKSERTAIALTESIRILSYMTTRIDISEEVAARSFDRLLDRWISQLSTGRVSLKANRQIYRTFRCLDRKLHGRVVRRLVTSVIRRGKNSLRFIGGGSPENE